MSPKYMFLKKYSTNDTAISNYHGTQVSAYGKWIHTVRFYQASSANDFSLSVMHRFIGTFASFQ